MRGQRNIGAQRDLLEGKGDADIPARLPHARPDKRECLPRPQTLCSRKGGGFALGGIGIQEVGEPAHRYRSLEPGQCPEMPLAMKHHGQTTSERCRSGTGGAHLRPPWLPPLSQLKRTVRCQRWSWSGAGCARRNVRPRRRLRRPCGRVLVGSSWGLYVKLRPFQSSLFPCPAIPFEKPFFTVTSFGESHGPAIGCVVDGRLPGTGGISEADIQAELDRRKRAPRVT